MSAQGRRILAKKACARCSTSKRRCDRAIPDCGLCKRFGRRCEYEASKASGGGSTPCQSPSPATFLSLEQMTPKTLKTSLIQKLEPLTPGSAVSTYRQAVEPWFPVISEPGSRFPATWEETSLDIALLCLSILLFTMNPSITATNDNITSGLETPYLQTKSSLAFAEGLGLNSVPIVQARILLTLFEVSHGFYPAAYISIGATLRATDALEAHPIEDDVKLYCSTKAVTYEETVLIWCGILVLDRYIAAESGSRASLTRPRIELLHNFLKPALCPTHEHNQDKNTPFARFSRLVESSSMLDKIHTTIHSPTPQQVFNMEEVMLTVTTTTTLKSILTKEINAEDNIYSGGLALCDIALILAFDNGTKVSSNVNITDIHNPSATTSLLCILSSITSTVEPFVDGTQPIDFDHFPPLVTFLVYKAAAITTRRVSRHLDAEDGLARLRTLRTFLRIVATRWLGCERYLKLLDEDTTPRMRKAIDQDLGSSGVGRTNWISNVT